MDRDDHRAQRGQALVFFVIALLAIIAMTGLVLDGGGAFAQRRDQQNAADLAAWAGATAYANTPGTHSLKSAAADLVARRIATANGYTSGTDGATVTPTVTQNAANGSVTVHVMVEKPHRNYFAGIVGQTAWDVSAEARAVTGIPNAAIGAMPIIFNKKAFEQNQPLNNTPPGIAYQEPGSGNQDVPQDATQFNWTVYCTGGGSQTCNADSNTIRDLVHAHGDTRTVAVGDAVSPLNAGSHTTIFDSLAQWVGTAFPVAIVDDAGNLIGWATFHLTGVEGASEKVIKGYFESGINAASMTITDCLITSPTCFGGAYGDYVIKLVD